MYTHTHTHIHTQNPNLYLLQPKQKTLDCLSIAGFHLSRKFR